MPARFRVMLRKKETIASDVVRFDFTPSMDDFVFTPGQSIQLIIPAIFDSSKAEGVRSFTLLYDAEKPGTVSIATALSESRFKKYLLDCPPGNSIEAFGPIGSSLLPEGNQPLCMITSGIGITALISLIRYSTEREKRDITLLYGGGHPNEMAFSPELFKLDDTHSSFHYHPFLTDDKEIPEAYRRGEVNSSDIKDILGKKLDKTIFIITGSLTESNRLLAELNTLDIDKSRIKTEIFAGYG